MKNENKIHYMPIGMCIGISVGMAIGAAFDNIGVGMCLGLSVGMSIGLIADRFCKGNSDDEKPENDKEN